MTTQDPQEQSNVNEYSTYLEFAKDLAKRGGLMAKDAQQRKSVKYSLKPHEKAHLVTEHDMRIERFLVREITTIFPEHAIYGEETGNHAGAGEFTWLIDPIDGTSNFAHGLPLYCTMLALMHRGDIVVAAIYLPVLDELFYASKGNGAFLNGRRLYVSAKEEPSEAFVFVERGGKENDDWYVNVLSDSQSKVMGTRILGSCGIQMAYVAAGRMDAFISKGTNLYDRAPGILFIQESGGIVLNFAGERYSISDKDLIAANATLAGELLKKIAL